MHENEPRPPFWEMKLPRVVLSWTTVTLMVVVAGIVMLAIVGYEMALVAAIFALDDHAAEQVAAVNEVLDALLPAVRDAHAASPKP